MKRNWLKSKEKGEQGEAIVIDYFIRKGFIVYQFIKKDKSEPIDLILFNPKRQELYLLDVKTKSRFNLLPITGMDLDAYQAYKELSIKHNMKLILAFVDDKTGTIHLNYPADPKHIGKVRIIDDIIAWELKNMLKIGQLNKDQIALLSSLDQRNYKYNPVD